LGDYNGESVGLSFRFTVIIQMTLFMACGPLPRSNKILGDLEKWTVSRGASGLVLSATHPSYSSTDIYFYDFRTGALSTLTAGESGDVLIKWQVGKLWIANRAPGRISYSTMSPRVGTASRGTERRTPGAGSNDPSDFILVSQSEGVMTMGASGSVLAVNFASGALLDHDFSDVQTGQTDVPFRPLTLFRHDQDIAVLHSSLDRGWVARGGGMIFIARKSGSGRWAWVDQDVPEAGVQGLLLNVSNPVVGLDCDGDSGATSCYVAGACYETMGNSCVGGVDLLDWNFKSVRHLFDWPIGLKSVGYVSEGPRRGTVLACLKSSSESNAHLYLFNASTGETVATWDSGASYCGPMKVDRTGERIFVAQPSPEGGVIYWLNSALLEQGHANLNLTVTGIEVVDE